MSHRKIVVESCVECPNRGHKGAFGGVRYKPICRENNRNLPYKTKEDFAIVKDGIPSWCPLEKNVVDIHLGPDNIKFIKQ